MNHLPKTSMEERKAFIEGLKADCLGKSPAEEPSRTELHKAWRGLLKWFAANFNPNVQPPTAPPSTESVTDPRGDSTLFALWAVDNIGDTALDLMLEAEFSEHHAAHVLTNKKRTQALAGFSTYTGLSIWLLYLYFGEGFATSPDWIEHIKLIKEQSFRRTHFSTVWYPKILDIAARRRGSQNLIDTTFIPQSRWTPQSTRRDAVRGPGEYFIRNDFVQAANDLWSQPGKNNFNCEHSCNSSNQVD